MNFQVQLAAGKGVKVATILEDPVVKEAEMLIYASHTKSFPVRGSGFVSVEDPGQAPSILLDGIPSSTYKIQVCMWGREDLPEMYMGYGSYVVPA